MKKTFAVILSAILTGVLLALAAFGLTLLIKNDEPVSETSTENAALSADGCYVTSLFSYTGEYPEDGSFESAENVAAVKIKNNSSIDIEQAEIKVKTDVGEYTFLAVDWMAGSEITVLDENRTPLEGDFTFESAEIVSISAFDEEPSLLPDRLEITTSGGIVKVKNISENDIDGELKIYLKLGEKNSYFGGTAFFVHVSGLPAGEEAVLDTGIVSGYKLTPVFAETEKGETAG